MKAARETAEYIVRDKWWAWTRDPDVLVEYISAGLEERDGIIKGLLVRVAELEARIAELEIRVN